MSVDSLPTTHRAVIPEQYMDQMGHMNVTWYTHLFNQATWNFFASFGMGREYFEANQAGAFALEAHVRYLAEIRAGARIAIRSRAVERSASRLHFIHFMQNEEANRLVATGEFLGAHIDMRTRRVADMPNEITAPLDQLIQEHSALDWEPPLCDRMRL